MGTATGATEPRSSISEGLFLMTRPLSTAPPLAAVPGRRSGTAPSLRELSSRTGPRSRPRAARLLGDRNSAALSVAAFNSSI